MSILQDLIEDESDDKPPYITLIDQLFSFIGSDPEKAVSNTTDLFQVLLNTNLCKMSECFIYIGYFIFSFFFLILVLKTTESWMSSVYCSA